MSSHKLSNFAVPATPSKPKKTIAQLVRNKWLVSSARAVTSSSSTNACSLPIPPMAIKNVNINGKVIPVKVLGLANTNVSRGNCADRVSTSSSSSSSSSFSLKDLGSVTPGMNRPSPKITSAKSTTESSNTNTVSAALLAQGTERSFNGHFGSDNVSSDVGGFDLRPDRIPYPIRDVGIVFEMEKQMSRSYMMQLAKCLRRQIVGQENVLLQLISFLYAPECASKFNPTGKKKFRFKSLKINNVLMALTKLKEDEYWRSVANVLHVMDRRYAREILKQKQLAGSTSAQIDQ